MTNPTGYFVENLWTNAKQGLMMPDDALVTHVNATGVQMFKATIAQGFNGYLYEAGELFDNSAGGHFEDF